MSRTIEYPINWNIRFKYNNESFHNHIMNFDLDNDVDEMEEYFDDQTENDNNQESESENDDCNYGSDSDDINIRTKKSRRRQNKFLIVDPIRIFNSNFLKLFINNFVFIFNWISFNECNHEFTNNPFLSNKVYKHPNSYNNVKMVGNALQYELNQLIDIVNYYNKNKFDNSMNSKNVDKYKKLVRTKCKNIKNLIIKYNHFIHSYYDIIHKHYTNKNCHNCNFITKPALVIKKINNN